MHLTTWLKTWLNRVGAKTRPCFTPCICWLRVQHFWWLTFVVTRPTTCKCQFGKKWFTLLSFNDVDRCIIYRRLKFPYGFWTKGLPTIPPGDLSDKSLVICKQILISNRMDLLILNGKYPWILNVSLSFRSYFRGSCPEAVTHRWLLHSENS